MLADVPAYSFMWPDDQVHKQDSTRTGSYSPCLSERETGSHANTPRRAQDAPQLRTFTTYAASTAQQSSLVESKPPAPVTRAFPGLQHIKQQPEKPSLTDPGPPAAGKTQSNGAPAQTRPFKSLQEAKKEAQKAILRLWPLGVRYQTYIDEGFDEYFIRSLFADLHLEMPQTAKDASEQIRAQPATKAGQNKNSPTSPQNALSSTSSHVNMPEAAAVEAQKAVTMSDKSGKAEERKDRIARLLAQKTAKPPAPSQQATAVQVSSAPAASSVKPAKVWGEKELLIQKKMEELKKNRGAQNSRSAGAAVQPQAQAPVADGVDQATRNAKADAVVQLLAGGPGSEPVRPSASRKRPVAADFADYSSTTNPPKRAHHQEQQESRLMTDVGEPSDGEEMDLDTSTPPSVAPTQRLDTSHRPARDFAPLTDTGSRTVSFPANGKNTQLERKEKELQEMKRKLAEALAKKQTKRNGTRPGSQTPQPEGAAAVNGLRSESPGTPLQRLRSSSGPSDGPSAQLFAEATASLDVPKPSRRGQLAPDMASRRMRIVSLDLPQVDSHLSAKVARLKELQEEIMSIQTEVDMCLSKKSRLAQELEQIDSSAAEEPPISNDDLSSVAKQHSDAPTNHAPFGVVGAEAKEGSSHPIDLAPSQLQDNTVDGSPANPIQEPAQKTDGQDKVRCTSTDAEVTGNVDEVTFRPDGAEDSRPSADDADSTEDNVPMDDSVSSDGEASANESESPEDDVPMDETKSSEGDAPMDDAESASASDEAADTTQLCMPDAATLAEAPVPTASTDGQAVRVFLPGSHITPG